MKVCFVLINTNFILLKMLQTLNKILFSLKFIVFCINFFINYSIFYKDTYILIVINDYLIKILKLNLKEILLHLLLKIVIDAVFDLKSQH